MARKVSGSVAYFDRGVDQPGFYELEGDVEESTVPVLDGDVNPNKTDDRGRVLVQNVKKVDEIKVKHESNCTPGARVEWDADKDHFVYAE